MNTHSDAGQVTKVDSGDRQFELVDIAIRITFIILGPILPFAVAISFGAAFEVITELIAWDSSYYQDHNWCPPVASVWGGSWCFVLRRVPYLESGYWVGPFFIAFGFYLALQ